MDKMVFINAHTHILAYTNTYGKDISMESCDMDPSKLLIGECALATIESFSVGALHIVSLNKVY